MKPKWRQVFFSSLYWGHQRLPVKKLRTQENERRKVSLTNGLEKKVSPIQVISLTLFCCDSCEMVKFRFSLPLTLSEKDENKTERCTLGCLLKILKLKNILKQQAMNVHVNRVMVNLTKSISFCIVADKAWGNLPPTLTLCYVWYKTFRAKAVSWKTDLFIFLTCYSLGISIIVCCTMTAGPPASSRFPLLLRMRPVSGFSGW